MGSFDQRGRRPQRPVRIDRLNQLLGHSDSGGVLPNGTKASGLEHGAIRPPVAARHPIEGGAIEVDQLDQLELGAAGESLEIADFERLDEDWVITPAVSVTFQDGEDRIRDREAQPFVVRRVLGLRIHADPTTGRSLMPGYEIEDLVEGGNLELAIVLVRTACQPLASSQSLDVGKV